MCGEEKACAPTLIKTQRTNGYYDLRNIDGRNNFYRYYLQCSLPKKGTQSSILLHPFPRILFDTLKPTDLRLEIRHYRLQNHFPPFLFRRFVALPRPKRAGKQQHFKRTQTSRLFVLIEDRCHFRLSFVKDIARTLFLLLPDEYLL